MSLAGARGGWPDGVRHVGDVSLICCSRTELGKAWPGTAVMTTASWWWWREGVSQAGRTGEGSSTDPGCAGGPARSSGEASALRGGGGAKGPGCL